MELHMTNKLLDDMKHYSKAERISELVKDGMDEEEAVEYYDYNIVGAYMGEFTPIYIDDTGV